MTKDSFDSNTISAYKDFGICTLSENFDFDLLKQVILKKKHFKNNSITQKEYQLSVGFFSIF